MSFLSITGNQTYKLVTVLCHVSYFHQLLEGDIFLKEKDNMLYHIFKYISYECAVASFVGWMYVCTGLAPCWKATALRPRPCWGLCSPGVWLLLEQLWCLFSPADRYFMISVLRRRLNKCFTHWLFGTHASPLSLQELDERIPFPNLYVKDLAEANSWLV